MDGGGQVLPAAARRPYQRDARPAAGRQFGLAAGQEHGRSPANQAVEPVAGRRFPAKTAYGVVQRHRLRVRKFEIGPIGGRLAAVAGGGRSIGSVGRIGNPSYTFAGGGRPIGGLHNCHHAEDVAVGGQGEEVGVPLVGRTALGRAPDGGGAGLAIEHRRRRTKTAANGISTARIRPRVVGADGANDRFRRPSKPLQAGPVGEHHAKLVIQDVNRLPDCV